MAAGREGRRDTPTALPPILPGWHWLGWRGARPRRGWSRGASESLGDARNEEVERGQEQMGPALPEARLHRPRHPQSVVGGGVFCTRHVVGLVRCEQSWWP